ncbi:MAG: Flp pilus assembly protein CpaB [Kiritimatiellae bacterium]|nr:Flp pilus assembly protein CpaB [Kiritimatiellia bacterium]
MKRKIVLVVSLAAGVIAALLTRFYIAAKDAEVRDLMDAINRRYGTMDVLCFKNEIPAGTVLQKDDLGVKSVPAIGMRGQALTVENVQDVVGRKVLFGHRRGDVVFWADVEGGNPAASGLSADVKRQMRAVSINCSGAASVSGMIRPNDHVDVIGTFDMTDRTAAAQAKAKTLVTCTILQNVLVLATGSRTAKTRSKDLSPSVGYSTVTLEVTPREAEMLAFAEQIKGRLVLTLRNRNDTSFEKELPRVDFEKIRGEIEELNLKRQQQRLINR